MGLKIRLDWLSLTSREPRGELRAASLEEKTEVEHPGLPDFFDAEFGEGCSCRRAHLRSVIEQPFGIGHAYFDGRQGDGESPREPLSALGRLRHAPVMGLLALSYRPREHVGQI